MSFWLQTSVLLLVTHCCQSRDINQEASAPSGSGFIQPRGDTFSASKQCMPRHFSHAWFFVIPWTTAHQAPLSFPRQEYWSELPFSSPLDPGIEPASPAAPALGGRFFTTEPSGKPYNIDGFTLISTLVNIFNTSPTLKQKIGEFVQEKMFVYWEISTVQGSFCSYLI